MRPNGRALVSAVSQTSAQRERERERGERHVTAKIANVTLKIVMPQLRHPNLIAIVCACGREFLSRHQSRPHLQNGVVDSIYVGICSKDF